MKSDTYRTKRKLSIAGKFAKNGGAKARENIGLHRLPQMRGRRVRNGDQRPDWARIPGTRQLALLPGPLVAQRLPGTSRENRFFKANQLACLAGSALHLLTTRRQVTLPAL